MDGFLGREREREGIRGKSNANAPLESGRTTEVMVAPQLVTLTEKSPALSSYTPTIFLPAALAEPRAAAHAHAHSSASRRSR